MKSLALILSGVLLNAGAQVVLKIGMRQIGYFDFSLLEFAFCVLYLFISIYYCFFGVDFGVICCCPCAFSDCNVVTCFLCYFFSSVYFDRCRI